MKDSITKAFLFVIALSTSVMAVQLIPISKKANFFNLCREHKTWWRQAYINKDDFKSNDKKKVNKFKKAANKSNFYQQKIYSEMNIKPENIGDEEVYAMCQRVGFDWYINL